MTFVSPANFNHYAAYTLMRYDVIRWDEVQHQTIFSDIDAAAVQTFGQNGQSIGKDVIY